MNTTRLFAVALALTIGALGGSADARPRPHGLAEGSKRFEANKKFGLGLELGEPTGITGKLFLSPSGALDFGVGEIYHDYYGGDGLHGYVDYLWHPLVLTSAEAFELPLYVGVGGRFWSFDYACGGGVCANATVFGVRVPVGIAFDFNNVPLDIFIQAVPTLDFFRNYSRHDVYLDIDFSVGIRYWFS
jgi:hypothetical protein